MIAKAPDEASEEQVRKIADAKAGTPGGLLPLLNEVQDQLGYVPDWAVPIIAGALNLSRADVHGVISFYHLYRKTAPGQHTVYICSAEACQSMGSAKLTKAAKQQLQIDFHETTLDGRFSLEPIYCLGNCACAPAVMIDSTLYGRVTEQRLTDLLRTDEPKS